MQAGLLLEQIEIWHPTVITNEFGEQKTEWNMVAKRRARVIHNNGGKGVENYEVFYNHNKTFQVRLHTPIQEFDRIKWNGQTYLVINIETNLQQQMITIITELKND